MGYNKSYDLEKSPVETSDSSHPDSLIQHHGKLMTEDGAVPTETFEMGDSWYAKAMRFAGKSKIEQRGIERVPENERTDAGFKALLNAGTMWLSANMVVPSFAIGLLARGVWYMGAVDAMLVVLFFNLIGVTPVCYFSTFGPRFGLRQMVLSRFWFGYHGVKLIAFFNCLACLGWSAVNCIVGAGLLHTVNTDVPGWAGIIIISICTFIITLFGYKAVHLYEFWSWVPATIIFLIVLGVFAHSGDFVNNPSPTGKLEMGAVLSFGAVVYGFATGWTSYAADYTVYQPSIQSRRKVFVATWLGLMIPLNFCMMLGVAVGSNINNGPNRYNKGYNDAAAGGILGAVLIYHLGGFGKFCMVVLALTVIANNCPNMYSIALSMQVLSRWTAKVPRFILTGIATVIYTAIAIPGYSEFEAVLENFMSFIGYWVAIYEGVSLTDHFVFKRNMAGYNPEHYENPEKLPPGIAAVLAFCLGIVGMVLGMSQKWYVGPIGLTAGEKPYGGDVGFELAFLFAAVGYFALRIAEKKYFGR